MEFRSTSLALTLGLAFPYALGGCDPSSLPAGTRSASRPGADAGTEAPTGREARDGGASCGLGRPASGALATSTGAAIAPASFRTRTDGSLVVRVGASRSPILELRLVAQAATAHTLVRASFPQGSDGGLELVVPASELVDACGSSLLLRLFGVVRDTNGNVDVEWRAAGVNDVGLVFVPCCPRSDGGCDASDDDDRDEDCDEDADEDVDEGTDEGSGHHRHDGGTTCEDGHDRGQSGRPRH